MNKEYEAREMDNFGNPIWRIIERSEGTATWLKTLAEPDFDRKDDADRAVERLRRTA